MHTLCNILHASSSLFLVTWPVGFSQDTRDADTSLRNGDRQRMGCAPVGSGVGYTGLGCGFSVQVTLVGTILLPTTHVTVDTLVSIQGWLESH